jgi:hypothetical protein
MKIELIKQTTKWTGGVYYFVEIDGVFQSGSFTDNPEKAEEYLVKTEELVRQYPETIKETIKTIEL